MWYIPTMAWDFKVEAISVGSRVPRAMWEKSSSNPQSGLGLQISLGLYTLSPHLTSLLLACWFTSSPFQGYSCLKLLVIQLLSHVWLFVTPQTAACQAPLSFTVSQTLLTFMSIESVMLPSHLILCLQSFPALGAFPVSCHFASGGQSIGASASASVLPMSIQGWFPLELTGLIFLLSKGLYGFLSSTTIWNLSSLALEHPPSA